MATIIQFNRIVRHPIPRASAAAEPGLVRLMADLNATYDAVNEAVRHDPSRAEEVRKATRAFMCNIALIAGVPK